MEGGVVIVSIDRKDVLVPILYTPINRVCYNMNHWSFSPVSIRNKSMLINVVSLPPSLDIPLSPLYSRLVYVAYLVAAILPPHHDVRRSPSSARESPLHATSIQRHVHRSRGCVRARDDNHITTSRSRRYVC